MCSTLFRLAERVRLQLKVDQAEVVLQPLAHQGGFCVDVRVRKIRRLCARPMELAIVTVLRTLVTKHRASVSQALRTVVQRVVLDHSAHSGSGASGTHGQLFVA